MLKVRTNMGETTIEAEGTTQEILADMTLIVANVLLDLIEHGALDCEDMSIEEFLDYFMEDFKRNIGVAMFHIQMDELIGGIMN